MPQNILLVSALILVVIALYGAFSYIRIQNLIAHSATLVAKSIPYQQNPATPTLRVLFIGDSAGVGVGASDSQHSIAGLFGHDHADWSIKNISVSGRRVAQLIDPLKKLPAQSFDIVFVQIGGNDSVNFTDTTALATNLKIVLTDAKRVGKRVIVYSTGNVGDAPLFPRPLAWIWERQTRIVRNIFISTSKDIGVTYVDLFREHDVDPFYKEPLKYHTSDVFHPSDYGYQYWYDAIKKTL